MVTMTRERAGAATRRPAAIAGAAGAREPVAERPARRLNDDQCWQAVSERRSSATGLFVVAVRTTKVYCRPGCPARMPKRENVEFYATPQEAESAGYRACLRCKPRERVRSDVALIQRVCARLDAAEQPPTLASLSREFGVSAFHLQRTFKRITGITPKQYTQARRVEPLKRGLRGANGVAAAGYDAGFGSSRGLYEQSPVRLGMTPAAYRRGGAGMTIRYTIATSAFGRMLVAATERGLSAMSFGERDADLEQRLLVEYPAADIAREDASMKTWLDQVLRSVNDGEPNAHLPLDIRATAFRARVYEALRAIPRGETRSYADIARSIGAPRAQRAVGNACNTNPVGYVIPCHRVVRSDGSIGGFRGGVARKEKMLARERSG